MQRLPQVAYWFLDLLLTTTLFNGYQWVTGSG